ncbi:MAG: NAD(P)H-hydrate dehydratase [Thermosphaera sp.]
MITTLEMKILETNSAALGVSTTLLMEAAGSRVADFVDSKLKGRIGSSIVVMVGKGGNGGDGLVAARYLSSKGYPVEVLLAFPPSEIEHPDTLLNFKIIKKIESVKIRGFEELKVLEDGDVIIDAILGTGVKGVLRDPVKTIIEKANNANASLKVAVDTPSGLDPDTGEVHGVAFKANFTITFHDLKPGLTRNPNYTGEVIIADIGIPREAKEYVGPGDVLYRIPKRPREAHKGSSGRVVIIAGSSKYVGAAYLTARASLEAGVDLSFLIVPREIRNIVASFSPDIITLSYDGEFLTPSSLPTIVKYVEELKPHSIAIGPGLGSRDETLEALQALIPKLIELKIPLVVDADALKVIKLGITDFNGNAVLTPHRGEFKALSGIPVGDDVISDSKAVKDVAEKLNAIVLLKAPVDIISDGKTVRFNKTGNPYMAVGGTGDVLTGLVAGLIPQVKNLFHSACIGAYLNGLAGDYLLRNNKSVTASNILKTIPLVKNKPLEIHKQVYG